MDAFENAISEQFQIEVAPSKGLRDGKKSSVGVTIGIPDLQNRVPVDVCCVVDISGSMGEDARFQDPENENLTRSEGISILDLVKHSVKAIMHTLTDQDRLSVVAFDSNAKIAVPLKEMTENGRKLAITALEKLRPEDNTNIWAGLYSGLEALRNPPKSTLINTAIPRKKTIILLTDGQPNQSPPEGEGKALFKYFEKYPDFKCQVNTFGFGYTLNSRLLLDIATVGSGTFAFIPDAKIVGTCFVSAVANLCSNLSQYCKVHLVLKNGATFAGPVSGNYSFQDTAWGRVVDIGPLYYGQNRDLSVPIHIPHSDEPYLDVTVEYDKSSGGTHKITYTASNRQPTSNSRAAVLRNKVVSNLIAIVDKCEKGNGLQAVQDMNTLSKKLADLDYANPLSENADNRLVALHDDVTGRMAKAISTVQRFKRWGKHYLLAITRSHQLQIKTNFMDPGLQVYGGSLFARLEDEGGKIFVTLPMKKTAAYHTQYIGGGVVGASTISTSTTPTAPTISPHTAPAPAPAPVQQANYTYYAGSGGGCFDAKCASVVIKKDSNGALEEVETHLDQLKKNDVVKVVNEKGEVGIATILCVVQIKLNLQAQNSLIQLNNGLKITKNHPIRVNGKWIKPKDHPEAVLVSSSSPYVYNFVLDRSHILLVNNTECCTFGHNIKDEVTYHPFYATNTVIETLSRLDGWEDGLVIVPRSLRSYHNTTNNYPALPRLQVSL
uniref:VWFA domain-containing protein n=1 Tax=Arcella intermedia TaxID=1963864 RepID=A0A6B2KYS2_9EUKA